MKIESENYPVIPTNAGMKSPQMAEKLQKILIYRKIFRFSFEIQNYYVDLHRRNGTYAFIEIKPGGEKLIRIVKISSDEAVLRRLRAPISLPASPYLVVRESLSCLRTPFFGLVCP